MLFFLSFMERFSVAANVSRAACEIRGDLTEIPQAQHAKISGLRFSGLTKCGT